MTRLALYFAAGNLGGFATALTIWLFGALGISAALGVAIAPPLTPAFIYPKMVWGGLWGFIFLLPIMTRWPAWARGLLFSLGPSFSVFLIFFPLGGAGFFGLALGTLTPLLVLIFNAVWGLVTAWSAEFFGARVGRQVA